MLRFSDERPQVLIEAGANVDTAGNKNRTALHDASAYGHTDIAKVGGLCSELFASQMNGRRC